MGAASIMFIATANSLLQLNSSGAMRGRVMALWAVVFLGSTPIGAPLIGFLAGRYGARFALGLGGVATLLIAGWAGFELRRIRNAAAAAASYSAIDAEVIEGSLSRGQ
jgi:MFS family permease